MQHAETSTDRLAARACGVDSTLRAFVEQKISRNAWPIHSRPLRRQIGRQGLDLAPAGEFAISLDRLMALMRRMVAASRRVERTLAIDNAFHTTVHNYEVLLRLLLLECPPGGRLPENLRHAVDRSYVELETLEPVLRELMQRLLDLGLPSRTLARDLLAAGGHDYGHSGDTDRLGPDGKPLPLTHEETAERHVAKFGLEFDFPPALILEALAGIRATTLHVRADREKVYPDNEFERKMTLADVCGCVMRPDLWMTHVAIPVLYERMIPWQRRLAEIDDETDSLRREIDGLTDNAAERAAKLEQLAALEAERIAPIQTVSEAFDNELRFLSFIRANRLAPVAAGSRLWSGRVDRRIALVERLLQRKDLLEPLDEHGFPLVEELTNRLANVESLKRTLEDNGINPNLKQLFAEFLPEGPAHYESSSA
ncbi:MAG: hypothetical protein AAF657_20835 [Acidobacteriota bacterium]